MLTEAAVVGPKAPADCVPAVCCAVLSRAKKRSGAGFGSVLSEPMQNFLGVESMARPQVVKAIWAYIKEHNLQVCVTGDHTGDTVGPGQGRDMMTRQWVWVYAGVRDRGK